MLEFTKVVIHREKVLFSVPDLKLELGEFVGLIGKNGAGKSTLMDALIHGSNHTGQLLVNGVPWSDLKFHQRARQITLVDNHFLGVDYLNVQEYLELGRHAYTNVLGRLSAEDKRIVDSYVQLLQISHLLKQSTSTLSDGERQRVGIAKALIQETPLVLLDEPTAFLDYPTKKEVMQLLKNIAKDQNRLVVVASHDINFCIEYCSRFLVIEQENSVLQSFDTISHDELVQVAFGIEQPR